MLKDLTAFSNYQFEQLNPSIIGNKIKWVSKDEDPNARQGLYFEVSSYEERSTQINYADTIDIVRTEIRIKDPDGKRFTVHPKDTFTVDEPYKTARTGLFVPDIVPSEYTYEMVGPEIVGNAIMATTGSASNHSWGDFMTGVVTSYKRSGAISYQYISQDSIMYEIGFLGMDRPVVVDSKSSFWA